MLALTNVYMVYESAPNICITVKICLAGSNKSSELLLMVVTSIKNIRYRYRSMHPYGNIGILSCACTVLCVFISKYSMKASNIETWVRIGNFLC